jgi:hypothetical protein
LPYAKWIADRQGKISNLNHRRIAQSQCRKVLLIQLNHGDVGLRIPTDDAAFKAPFIGEEDLNVGGVLHNVIVCEDVSLGANNDAGPQTLLLSFSGAAAKLVKKFGPKKIPEGTGERRLPFSRCHFPRR